jgi:adenylate cyclase
MQPNTPSEPASPDVLERHLATIMMADVVGYSRLMGENEEGTVRMLRGHREVFDALLRTHRGRIFNTAGDAILAEFPSAVEAVRCATEIQSALRTRNEHFPPEQRMWFRIGINLGDVIVQGTDLLGDGVNVAARIQTVAEPGGVCISGSVYDQIQNKLTLQFTTMGERSFKNIAQPIRTFSISDAQSAVMPKSRTRPSTPQGAKKWLLLTTGVLVLFLVTAVGSWLYRGQEERQVEQLRKEIALERQTAEAETATWLRQQAAAEEARRQERQAALTAEMAQRQALLEQEAAKAKAALEQAQRQQQRLDQQLKQAQAEKKAAEAQRLAVETQALKVSQEQAVAEEVRRRVKQEEETQAAKAAHRFDGVYEGTLCNGEAKNREGVCWPVILKVRGGMVNATWTTRSGKQGVVRGTIAPDGAMAVTLESWQPDGQAIDASLVGEVAGTQLRVSGTWSRGLPVTGVWTRSN